MDRKESLKFEISSVDVFPVIRVAVILFSVIGLMIGLGAFLVFPQPSALGLSFSTRFLSAVLFAVLYTLILALLTAFTLWFYNYLTSHFKLAVTITLSKPDASKEKPS